MSPTNRASPRPGSESPTAWDALAERALAGWLAAGAIELDPALDRATLVDALADLLAGAPSPAALEDFMMERDEVAELFVSGRELASIATSSTR